MNLIRCLALCGLVAGASALAGCAQRPVARTFGGDALGTFYSVQYKSARQVDEQRLHAEVAGVLEDFESELSNWRTNSWISSFNAAPAGVAVPVPEHAFAVLRLCLELAEHSGGRFDPTIGPLVELWGFGTQRHDSIPNAAEIERALQRVGWSKLALDHEHRTLTKTQDGVQLNCSAVAKGYAVDLVATRLRTLGIENHLVNIGGEIAARGSKPGGAPWMVAVPQPSAAGGLAPVDRVLSLTNRCVATSGHSQRYLESEGQRFTHILDATTGRPVPAGAGSVTVLAPTCALADGLATLALILDEEEMSALLAGHYPEVELFRTVMGTTR